MKSNLGEKMFRVLFSILAMLFCLPLCSSIEAAPSKIRVAIFMDQGSRPRPFLLKALEAAPDISLSHINGDELREGNLNDFDLLLVPGGSTKIEAKSMKEEGRREVRNFVARGGLYLGICAGCYLLTEAKSTDLGLLPLDTLDKAHWQRGRKVLHVELTPKGKEIFGVNQNIIQVLFHNGPIIDASHVTPESIFVPLGFYRDEIVHKKGKKNVMKGSPAMFMGRFKKGLVMGISPHPEADIHQVNMELSAIRWMYRNRVR